MAGIVDIGHDPGVDRRERSLISRRSETISGRSDGHLPYLHTKPRSSAHHDDAKCHSQSNPVPDCNLDRHAYAYTHTHQDADTYTHADIHSHPDRHAYSAPNRGF